ncbi:imidazole glycerol phosphate synthase subunit HisH [Limosilactobacillus gastricus]|uniref:Imidazole glycerol phosphate synthase subunit HisH n=1 Tax=Limosilactobacillus gastricus DSM 16045 TaxID=1423749 RepID=A0A0R1VFR8_9LACO|nr:imidazole glycerol phosphate synthase subunit HisH [Limosilactobacillus gastricus]KRM02484.1 Imidazole glycerol phosphate synthase, glutamine amidotransferase subunit [Limosilactobacillus gastricus DSM 16045]QGF40204.1 imidazole glycerol phosphate synthase subunit HisH [Limosilactobacillus gastricus]
MIAIIDYGAGNTFNVQKAFDFLGVETILTSDPKVIDQSSALILPGVGAFKAAMDNLQAAGLVEIIKTTVANGKPLLGICLGMQMLFNYSEEYGQTAGLGLIPGKVVAIPDGDLLVPQMGWNQQILHNSSSVFKEVANQYTYFVHSYYAQTDPQYITSTVEYGVQVPAIVEHDQVIGMQFHPEKSGQVGLQLLKDFVEKVVTK